MNKIQQTLNETDTKTLCEITTKQKYTSTLLPIKTVGVQVIIDILLFVNGVQNK